MLFRSRCQVVESGAQIPVLPTLAVVPSLAPADAAEVETQDRDAGLLQGARGAEDHVVVHGAPVQRVRMTHDGGGKGLALGVPERSLETPGRSLEVDLHGGSLAGSGSRAASPG